MAAKDWMGLAVLLTSCSTQVSTAPAAAAATAGDATSHIAIDTRGTMPVPVPVPECRREQLLGYVPEEPEIKEHRQSPLPTIQYAFNSKLNLWGLDLTLRVDDTGRIACYSTTDRFGRPQFLNEQRLREIENLRHWRYMPFAKDGVAVAAIINEHIGEEELPEQHVPLPAVPLEHVRISLERTGCFGSCPSYRVEINGDGLVVYSGKRYVDVEGEHAYQIPTSEVARLVESLRTKDLWSLRPVYRASVTDNPTYLLTFRLGEQEHQIEDYVGRRQGMPRVVSEFEDEVDRVARSAMWVNLSSEAIDRLEAEGFQFDSPAAGKLLERAIANRNTKDSQALARLIALGAPLPSPETLMEEALRNQRIEVIDPLISHGALETHGKPDRNKIDAAFRAAIAGGRLALVQKIWEVSGDQARPSLTFNDSAEDEGRRKIRKQSPVTLLLSHWTSPEDSWEGMEIAQWLAQRGCDLNAAAANGNTLLHIAARAGDARFVRHLLQQGLDASAPGEYGLPPLGSASDEDVALLLLQAGSDPSRMGDNPHGFRRYAEDNHWKRVVDWLRVRGK